MGFVCSPYRLRRLTDTHRNADNPNDHDLKDLAPVSPLRLKVERHLPPWTGYFAGDAPVRQWLGEPGWPRRPQARPGGLAEELRPQPAGQTLLHGCVAL